MILAKKRAEEAAELAEVYFVGVTNVSTRDNPDNRQITVTLPVTQK